MKKLYLKGKSIALVNIFLSFALCSGYAQSGTAFRDYNGNGLKDINEPGVRGILVKSYTNADVLYGTATTNAQGNYILSPAAMAGQKLRIEFEIPATGTTFQDAVTHIDFHGISGATYGSAVQFVTGNTNGINFAINNPDEYTNVRSYFATTIHATGNSQDPTGNAAQINSVIAYPIAMQDWYNSDSAQILATQITTGTTWGLAYSRASRRLFSAALLRRHSALGSLGVGGIYVTNLSAGFPGATTGFVNLSAIGINVGNISSNTARGLGPNTYSRTFDAAIFDSVCKIGIGGLDLSEDGRYLYTINLYERKLLKIDLRNAAAPQVPTAAEVAAYTLPNPGCNNGQARPFAVKVYRGMVYIGMVCDASGSLNRNDLTASVYTFNTSTAAFTPVLNFPLNYRRGQVLSAGYDTTWQAWRSNWPNITDYYLVHPEPVLADIDFDASGAMMLAFTDRFSYQGAAGQPNSDDPASTQYVLGSGDLIRAYNNNGIFTVENNGICGTAIGSGTTNEEGPGGGEFYAGDHYFGYWSPYDVIIGGVANVPGKDEVHALAFDVYGGNDNGTICLSNTTGARKKAYQVIDNTDLLGIGKGAGLGDLEMIADAAPIEIGNRVWLDTDGDGIQDADENGIADVVLQLYDGTGTSLLATTTSNANGNFYFNHTSFAGGLKPGTAYLIRVGSTQFNNAGLGVLNGLLLSPKNTIGNGIPGSSDNDATLVSGRAQVSFTTGGIGQSNHNIDFGFKPFITLPLHLRDFNASRLGKKSLLNWETTAEEPDTRFAVQRSENGTRWSPLGTVFGAGIATGGRYTYTDERPMEGITNYYRLQVTDITAKTVYSEIRMVKFDRMESLGIFPNPSRDLANIRLPEKMIGKAITIEVIDTEGRRIAIQQLKMAKPIETITLTGMGAGKYMIRVSFGEETLVQPLLIL
jgi:hypothetical protein